MLLVVYVLEKNNSFCDLFFNVNCKLIVYNICLYDYYWYFGNVKCML